MNAGVVKWLVIENIITLMIIALIVVGVAIATRTCYGFWALLLLFNMNTISTGRKMKDD
ncbi:hypothetical protein [Bradyrhizobium cenepequi]|uniref:hypothetical protein n=1 Tax=Bradyrhizobium cenepequi TaxID=2821403 RepID=UPI001CE39CCE|nr:hypothetical protein [Bradyrhizobium cenepequi]